MYEKTRYLTAGDSALVMEFGNEISETVNAKVRAMAYILEKESPEGIRESMPTYRSLMVHYDPVCYSFQAMTEKLMKLENKLKDITLPPPMVTEIPTLYGGEYGPDLLDVAAHTELTPEEVIALHAEPEYLIYMLGFTPGFPYLGGMNHRIAAPRLEQPRTKIRGGSVGIAGLQTGIYSVDSPGGWRLIGWTPVKLYDLSSKQIFLLKAGSYVRFKPITQTEYAAMKGSIDDGNYQCITYPRQQGGEDYDHS